MSGTRPAVDVVVPVAARDTAALAAVVERMRGTLSLGPHDTLTVVDNRGLGVPGTLAAPERRTSYYARNRGAAVGSAPWLLFLDADVVPEPGLLDALFAPAPGAGVGVLSGAIEDAAAPAAVDGRPAAAERSAGLARRFVVAKGAMSAAPLLARGEWAFAQTANAAVRREAFVAAGGFFAGVRSGGDADLCFRLRAAGWALEARPGARVRHLGRARVRGLLAQRVRHGSGAGWLDARWPGALPARRWPGLLAWGLRRMAAGARAAARGDTDAAALGLLDGPTAWAFELGRRIPNRPLRRGS